MLRTSVILTLLSGLPAPASALDPIAADVILRGGTLIDGTGAPGRRADVAIKGDRIVAIGDFEPEPGAEVIDVTGCVVAPGFIDLHTHSDRSIVRGPTRDNRNYLAQGVTTIVTGNCGSGPVDVARFLGTIDEEGAGSNVIHLIPQGSLRNSVMGNDDRAPEPDELEEMKALVESGMEAGAWGMSTGLIYLPGRYSETAELIELAKVVSEHGGLYASHIRDEGQGLLRSIDEALEIGEKADLPVHISHLKSSGKAAWGLIVPACEKIEAARAEGRRVSADQYPYIASSTSLGAMVVPDWALRGSQEDFAEIADDPEDGPRLREAIASGLERRDGGASVRIARYGPKPDWVGLDLAAIAEREGTSGVEVVVEIQRNGGASAISFGMNEEDVRHAMARDFVATASDGSAHAPGGEDRPHPRSYGTFPRKVRYALDEEVINLEHAIRSSSGLPAEILGLADRGVLRVGAYADVVVFDPETFRDAATFDDPTRYAEGARFVFVNGKAAIADGEFLGELHGRAIRLRQDGPTDLILKVGRIWTGDPDRPFAEALAARSGEIVAVGSVEEVERWRGPKTEVIERPEGFATPGLIDSHAHMTGLGASLEEVDLRGVASLEEVRRLVQERIEAVPGDGWITGRNWDQSLWPGGEFPDAAALDEAAPDRPVWLRRVDGHAAWANSEAMRRAGITRDSEAPPDGQILRDEDGDPTGVFVDGAMGLVGRVVPSPSGDEIHRQLLAAQDAALEAGLTGIHDAGIGRAVAETYRDLDREGLLKIRVYAMASPPEGGEVEFVRMPPAKSEPGSKFEMRAIKLFIDGAMGSRGALLFEPYSDDPENHGLYLIDPETLRETVAEALRRGWQVCTHAIGDKGNALVLDAYLEALKEVPEAEDPRLRVEHAQVVRRGDLSRFAEGGIIASMQPSHASTDKRWADARLGPERVLGAYAWRWFVDAGVAVAFGSDFPVEVASPFWGLYAAVTRLDEQAEPPGGWHPEQLLTLHEALRAFTAGSAHAAFAEDRLGVLKPGMRADITVIDRDLFRASPSELLGAVVTETVVDGEVVYRRD